MDRHERQRLGRLVSRRLAIWMPVVNLAEAAITYVFIAYVVPLPGAAPPAAARLAVLEAAMLICGLAWLVCDRWGRYAFAPVLRWLDEGGEPTDAQRRRTVRFPLAESGHVLAVWSAAAAGFASLDAAVGGSTVCSVLVFTMVVLGGCVASALSYLVAERVTAPIIARALEVDPPTRPLLPGIATRIFVAWEFGTAVAVGGAVVVALAALSGAVSASRLAGTVIFLGAVALLVGLVTLLIAVRSVADPIRAVRAALARVESGDTDVTVAVNDGGEIGLLQAGFNRMVAGLRERDRMRELFGRQVGEEVADSALERGVELGGEIRHAAVLFVDIVGSTPFAAAHDPREVVETLNHLFSVVVEVVTEHGGWVNKFEGDAALCVFGAPSDHPCAAGAALGAARVLSARLTRELDGLDVAIGLSAGEVVAGYVGAANRYEYTLVGDAVNEAARLTELAKMSETRIMASGAVVREADHDEAARWDLRPPVILRGRTTRTTVAVPR